MMHSPCPSQSQCIFTLIGLFLIWWAAASILLWLCWNRVLGALFKLKQADIWQAFLFVATVSIFVLPCGYLKKMGHDSRCRYGRFEHTCDKRNSKEDCPYLRQGRHSAESVEKSESANKEN